jgi:DNA-binding response OmpR family regulator
MANSETGTGAKSTPPFSSADAKPPGSSGPEMQQVDLCYAADIRLLVVDDDAQICRLVAAALADAHFEIDVVSDPARMEKRLKSKPYHIVILDYVIPGVTSDQLLGWVRDYQPEASVIVVTGFPSIDSALQCLRAGTVDYLTKPFQMAELRQVVRRCLENKGLLRMSEEALRESLGAAIRERRRTLGLTLAQLSERTGISLGYLSQIELGKNSASIETLYRISLGLRVKLADMFETVQIHGETPGTKEVK